MNINEPINKLICDRCGFENEPQSNKCTKCNSGRFAPPWVLIKRPINRQVSVEITTSNPKFGPIENRITLAKWWAGGSTSFNIPNPEQWQAIQKTVNDDLGCLLGWESAEHHIQRIQQGKIADKDLVKTLQQLADQHPDLFSKLLDSLDPTKLGKHDLERLAALLTQLADMLSRGSAGFREAFIAVLNKLPKQGQKALERLDDLLHTWSLQQITSVAQTVRSRLDTIELLKRQIMDERTYEIIGDNSIHRILERAMWMIDERYWLLKSNSTLRTFIGNEMAKLDKKEYGKKRPDFVCGSIGEKLIIVELKRPSKTLKIEDINQLETYLTIAEQYTSDFKSYEAYLMGNKKDDDLMRRLRHRSSNFNVWTYADLINRTEERYRKYLEWIES